MIHFIAEAADQSPTWTDVATTAVILAAIVAIVWIIARD